MKRCAVAFIIGCCAFSALSSAAQARCQQEAPLPTSLAERFRVFRVTDHTAYVFTGSFTGAEAILIAWQDRRSRYQRAALATFGSGAERLTLRLVPPPHTSAVMVETVPRDPSRLVTLLALSVYRCEEP